MSNIQPIKILWCANDWPKVYQVVLAKPIHEDVLISKKCIAHPESMQIDKSLGAPQGQIGDYRVPLQDQSGIHIREFADHYAVHRDKIDPRHDPLGHLIHDAPEWGLGISILSGAAIGYIATTKSEKRGENILKGIGIGFGTWLVLSLLRRN